jgi:repressor LexA
MERLTAKQSILLFKIEGFINEFGYSPSIRELCDMTNHKSTATIYYGLNQLKRKGYIQYQENKNRTIRIINLPNRVLQFYNGGK